MSKIKELWEETESTDEVLPPEYQAFLDTDEYKEWLDGITRDDSKCSKGSISSEQDSLESGGQDF
jgi:hypothetical protein